jgi:adenylate kinase
MIRRIVAVTGLSGVGKSTVIKALAVSNLFEHLQASTLIKEGRHASGGNAPTQDQLRFVDIDENQQFLIRGFEIKTSVSTGLVILDGHTVIEQNDALIRIDARVFGAVGIDSMIFLNDDPETIAKRRHNDKTRSRPVASIDKLRLIQEIAQHHANEICRDLDVPLHILRPYQQELIEQIFQQHSRNRE